MPWNYRETLARLARSRPRNMMIVPGRKGSSSAGQKEISSNAHKTGFSESKIRLTFLASDARRPKMLRAGLYARVSTIDQQTLPMQNRAMREYAARRGWTIAMQVREVNSGAAKREAREKLLEAARRREIDLVLVWRLDRWGRSVTDLLATLQELEHLGVGFVSLTEASGSDHAGRSRDGRIAGRFRGVRARDSAGENQGWLGACPTERANGWVGR